MLQSKKKIMPAVVQDSISDTVARVRNALMRKLPHTHVVRTKFTTAFLQVLKAEGYINAYEPATESTYLTKVHLKYVEGRPAIAQMRRFSTQGRRVYVAASEIPMVRNGLGIAVLSTSKGVLSDADAVKHNVGGELLCSVF